MKKIYVNFLYAAFMLLSFVSAAQAQIIVVPPTTPPQTWVRIILPKVDDNMPTEDAVEITVLKSQYVNGVPTWVADYQAWDYLTPATIVGGNYSFPSTTVIATNMTEVLIPVPATAKITHGFAGWVNPQPDEPNPLSLESGTAILTEVSPSTTLKQE